jgi:hypothetical protein
MMGIIAVEVYTGEACVGDALIQLHPVEES